MIQALILDFDGLILETELPDFQSWQEIYQHYGGTFLLLFGSENRRVNVVPIHAQAPVFWQESWMNIENPILVC